MARLRCLALAMIALASTVAAGDISKYYAAEEIEWNYAPSGKNLCNGASFSNPASVWTVGGIGSTYIKAKYIEYTDSSYTVRLIW